MAANARKFPPQTRGQNFFTLDDNLRYFLERTTPDMLKRQQDRLTDFGQWVGTTLDEQAEYSDRHAPPRLEKTLAAAATPGARTSRVIFNPAYEQAQAEVYKRGVIGLAFDATRPEPHTLSFAMGYLLSHSDISTHCPVTMTGAVAYVVNKYATPFLRQKFLHQSTRMDGHAKTGGTWATEKHSGSDIAQTTTTATPRDDGTYRLNGQKWFASNAASGLAVATARPDGAVAGAKGLGLYLVPSHIDDDWTVPNSYTVTALKEKLGTRALATAELDLNDTHAIGVVPPPYGLRVMMEALGYSRVHNAMSAAGITHRALMEVQSWMEHRVTFGKPLIDRPVNQKKMVGMAVDWLSASALAFESAHSFDLAQSGDPAAGAWMRMVTAIAKYRSAAIASHATINAVNMIGGNGITADWPTERLARDTMVLAVWEGPEQIQALDLIRMLTGPEKGAEIFIDRLNALARTLPADLRHDRMSLNYRIGQLKQRFDDLLADPASAEYDADDLLHHASDVLTYALLCHEAGWELTRHQNPTKTLAARKFYDTRFLRPHDHGRTDRVRLTLEFNALIRGIAPPVSAIQPPARLTSSPPTPH